MRTTLHADRNARSTRGFSLLELIVVIGVLVAFAGTAVALLVEEESWTANRITLQRIEKLKEGLLHYARDTVRCRVGNDTNSQAAMLGVFSTTSVPGGGWISMIDFVSSRNFGIQAQDQGAPNIPCSKGGYFPDPLIDPEPFLDG